MNDNTLLPDDPQLTAYALGELDGDERAAVEAALRLNPALRATVEEIRATAAQLEAALATEAAPEGAAPVSAPPLRRAAIIPGDDYRRLDGGPLQKIIQFPRLYYVIGGAAAACFAVVLALRGPQPSHEAKRYIEVALQPADKAQAAPAVEAAPAVAETDAVAPKPDAMTVALPAAPAVAVAEGEKKNEVTPAVRGMFDVPATGLLERSRQFAEAAKDAKDAGTLTINVNTPAAVTYSGTTVTAAPGESMLREAARTEPQLLQAKADQNVAQKTSARTLAMAGAPVAASAQLSGGTRTLPANTTLSYGGAPTASTGDVVTLSPFSVSTGRDQGFGAGAAGVTRRYFPTAPTDLYPGPAPRLRENFNTESYAYQHDNAFVAAAAEPLSTFSIDVDTASYANVRRFLAGGRLPPPDAVRIEELVNYFPYRYAAPVEEKRGEIAASPGKSPPFAATLEVAEAPWAPTHRLVRIGLKGREVALEARPAANLVFLLDVSGSMNSPNKLPLVKESMRLLVGKLRPDDRVAIVTYAGNSGLALASTPVAQSREILEALDALTPGGATNGAMGIQLAYDVAKANFATGGINRIILCTDGDFNVGVASQGALTRLVEEKTKSGVFLTVLGFGMGNYKDSTLELLADKGNGNYGYVDSRKEAEKLLVEQVNGTLVTIAKDVKLQVDFNPAKVARYRLIGYENRMLKKEDFNNDQVDAGEIGAGHTVTALYEVVPVGVDEGAAASVPVVDESKYAVKAPSSKPQPPNSNELLTLRVRYKEPTGDTSQRLDFPLTDAGRRFTEASADFKFAAAVAQFGMILRGSPHRGVATMGDVIAWAAAGAAAAGDDPGGHRSDFLGLARQAQALLR